MINFIVKRTKVYKSIMHSLEVSLLREQSIETYLSKDRDDYKAMYQSVLKDYVALKQQISMQPIEPEPPTPTPTCTICKFIRYNMLGFNSSTSCGAIGFKQTSEVYNTPECKKLYEPQELLNERD